MNESKSQFIGFSSRDLPNEVKLNIFQHIDQEVFPDEAEYLTSQAYYKFLTYEFEYTNERQIVAKAYLSNFSDARIIRCWEPGQDSPPISECRFWPETRDAVLTLLAFDFSTIKDFSYQGFSSLTNNAYDIRLDEIIAKKQRMSEAVGEPEGQLCQ